MNRIDRFRHWWTLYKLDVLAVGVLLVLAGWPRLFGLGVFLTADEKNWIGRSYEFVRAFKDFRFNEMLQTTHPGVTTLWVVGAAVAATIGFKHIPFASQNLRHFVVPAQLPVALLNTLAVPAMYVLLRKLLPGRLMPFLAAALVALDPFIIGYSRVAHVDALLMSFLWLAALSMLSYANHLYDRRYLVIGSVFSGLAILTKVPAIFIVPFLGLILLLTRPDFIRHRSWLHHRGRDGAAFLLFIAVMVVFIWPALLFVPNPQGNVLTLKRDYVDAALIPHDMTEDYSLNVWHYPAALLARATPVVQFFALILCAILMWELVGSRVRPGFTLAALAGINRRTVWLFLLYIMFFTLMMTLGAKKGDRYILPIWPALDTLAAVGIFAAVSSSKYQVVSKLKHLLVPAVGVAVLLWLAITVYRYHPYEIAYSNPLFSDNLSQELGWGEGLDQVGAWLTANAPEVVVASWYPEELRAYTSARVIHINGHEQNQVQYVVLYHNMFGRSPDHWANNFIDEYYKKREPVFVAHVAGKEFAWVYKKKIFERVVGELVPGAYVRAEVRPQATALAGVEIMGATYSGRARQGTITLGLISQKDGAGIGEWVLPVSELKDTGWTRFLLPIPIDVAGDLSLKISGQGTLAGAAPTIRYTAPAALPSSFIVTHNGEETAQAGDLAVRLIYGRDGRLATDDDTKLLESF